MTQVPHSFALKGGLDLVSPALAVPASFLVSGLNYEPLAEGYGRVQGYERYNGKPAPSDAQFWLLKFTSGSVPIQTGDLITGTASSGAGYVLIAPVDETGDWGAGTRAGTLVLTQVSGTFTDGDEIRVGGVIHALTDGSANADDAPTEDLRQTYLQEAQSFYRALIQKVPGDGPVRGVAIYNGNTYAWRDTAPLSAFCNMYRASASGWNLVALNKRVNFTAGLVEINEGDVIDGVTSGGSATVERVVRRSGSWGTDAAGYLILSNIAALGGAEDVEVGGIATATIGVITQQTIPSGGKFHTINHNFYGAADRYRMYGCNGRGNGFEFDGSVFAQIETGMVVDTPTRVFEINNHLGFTFPGGSIQFSSITAPLEWEVITGAGEIGLGTEINDVVQAAQTAVAFFGAQKVAILEGTDSSTFLLRELTEEAGGDAWTAQKVGRIIYHDARGLRDLAATQTTGGFKAGTISELIDPYLRTKRAAGVVPVASHVCRSKSQYRLYWSDASGLTVYMGGKKPEAIPFTMGEVQAFSCCVGELANGEAMMVGAEDGFVYRVDSGTSFDGAGIKGFCMTPFNHLGSITLEKRLHKVTIEMQSAPSTRIGVTVMFDYADGYQPNAASGPDFLISGGGGIWDVSFWNQFYWSAPYSGKAEAFVDGAGVNMSTIIAADSMPTEAPHILQSYTLLASPRRFRR